ncbi:MAG: hypothetical protein EA381_04405 [Planctomycetaceae bacterium]|nr:MAG: hypothetical protein EA381_04405 [Planctomycetaceae bacterium]
MSAAGLGDSGGLGFGEDIGGIEGLWEDSEGDGSSNDIKNHSMTRKPTGEPCGPAAPFRERGAR